MLCKEFLFLQQIGFYSQNLLALRDPDLARPRSYRTRLDTKLQSQTSNNSWVHAVGFVILAAIVISWALGY